MTNSNSFKSVHYFLVIINCILLMSLTACSRDDAAKQLKLEQLQTKWNGEEKKWQAQELRQLVRVISYTFLRYFAFVLFFRFYYHINKTFCSNFQVF